MFRSTGGVSLHEHKLCSRFILKMFPQLTSWLAEKDHKAGFKVRIRQNPQKEMFVCVTSSESDTSDWFSDRSVLAVHTHQHKHVPPPKKTTLIPASTRLMCNNKPFIYGVIWCNTGTIQENSPEKKKPGGKGLPGVEVRETARKQFWIFFF